MPSQTDTPAEASYHTSIAVSPAADFSEQAHIRSLDAYRKLAQAASADPEGFWSANAKALYWFRPWKRVLDWSKAPVAQWFTSGQTNLSYNALDRHRDLENPALIWEAEDGSVLRWSFATLLAEVSRCANALQALGVRPGDRVIIYLPMIPEVAVAMLACLRIGAVHCVVFAAFSAEAVKERIHDCGASWMLTADGGYRRGQAFALKANVNKIIDECPSIKKIVVVERTKLNVAMKPERDLWWHELLNAQSSEHLAMPLDSEAPAFILYTSGTTGKPKGIVHTTGGYMVQVAYSARMVFDLKPSDIFWCTADVGWITGHSYTLYGALLNGVTTVLFEGAPNFPDCDRFWATIAKHRVSIFYTAPTAIRTFIKWGDAYPQKHDLSSLRLLGTVGEAINPAAWDWYQRVIGGGRCPIVDTWWQTETGAIMISPLPGATPTKAGSATLPLPGIAADVVTESGRSCAAHEPGYLVLKKPWPAMTRGIWGDAQRFKDTYWSKFAAQGWYCPMDGAVKDDDGYIWIRGRVDDIIIVSGHNIGSAEIESALVSHPSVAEAAVVGIPDEITGKAIVAFVTLKADAAPDNMEQVLRKHCGEKLGAHAKPKHIRLTDVLPKTRSGKIMRRLLRDVAEGKALGDTTTLENFEGLKNLYEDKE